MVHSHLSGKTVSFRSVFDFVGQNGIEGLAGSPFLFKPVSIRIRQIIGEHIHSLLLVDHACIGRIQSFNHINITFILLY